MAGDYMQGNPDKSSIVPFSDDETAKDPAAAELAEEEKPPASPEEHKTRWQKNRERFNRILNEGQQSKKELEQERAEKAELKERLARLEGYTAAQTELQRQKVQNDVDPYQKRLDEYESKRREAWTSYQAEVASGKMNDDRTKHYERLSREIDEGKAEVFAERAIARRAPQVQQDSARQYWVNQYPDVYRDQRAFQYAEARYKMRQAEGHSITEEVAHEILQEARVKFSLGPKKAPSASERDRFSGMGTSGSGSAAANDNNGIEMKPEFKKMATALYPDLPEKDAYKKWVNGPGKKLRAAKAI